MQIAREVSNVRTRELRQANYIIVASAGAANGVGRQTIHETKNLPINVTTFRFEKIR